MDVVLHPPRHRRTRDAVDLLDRQTELSRSGIAADELAYVTCHVGVPTWKQARAVRAEAQADGWCGTFYVEPGHWVVRLVKSGVPSAQFLDEAERFSGHLAHRNGGRALAVTVEHPLRGHIWDELAARVGGRAHDQEDEAAVTA